MYLHDERETFKNTIISAAQYFKKDVIVIEKDYYVTMILRLLSQYSQDYVFKGGTSLSKGFHVMDRFSEDIDIAFEYHLGESRRKKLKHEIIEPISTELKLPISNLNETRSRRNRNAYIFEYNSVFEDEEMVNNGIILPHIKVETALASLAFPTDPMSIISYIGKYIISEGSKEIVSEYHLDEFYMKLQSIERTYIDKIFASCDYYMEGQSTRCSRHLYDICKIAPYINMGDGNFSYLFEKVLLHRREMNKTTSVGSKLICPSAEPNIYLPSIIEEFCNNDFYKEDYENITRYFANDLVPYEDTIRQMKYIAQTLKEFPLYKNICPD